MKLDIRAVGQALCRGGMCEGDAAIVLKTLALSIVKEAYDLPPTWRRNEINRMWAEYRGFDGDRT